MNYTIKKKDGKYVVFRNSPAGEPVTQVTYHQFDSVKNAEVFVGDIAKHEFKAPTVSVDLRG